jgi:hypothetical protein
VAESADATDLKSVDHLIVPVRVRSAAPGKTLVNKHLWGFLFFNNPLLTRKYFYKHCEASSVGFAAMFFYRIFHCL